MIISLHLPFGLSLSDRQVEEDQKTSTLSDLCRNNKSPRSWVLPCVKTRAGTSEEVGYGDCYDDEESHHEDLDGGDTSSDHTSCVPLLLGSEHHQFVMYHHLHA